MCLLQGKLQDNAVFWWALRQPCCRTVAHVVVQVEWG